MYSIKKTDNKECNTAKGVRIAIEFNKFKDILFGKKIIISLISSIMFRKLMLRQKNSFLIKKATCMCIHPGP